MIPIETRRLVLRRFTGSDPMTPYGFPADRMNMSFDYAPERADQYYSEYPFPGGGWFAICLGINGVVVERVGLLYRGDLFSPPEIELAYGLAEQHRGKGYATEACKGMLPYALSELRLPRLFAGISVENLPSQRVAERCGLRFDRIHEWHAQKHKVYWVHPVSETR